MSEPRRHDAQNVVQPLAGAHRDLAVSGGAHRALGCQAECEWSGRPHSAQELSSQQEFRGVRLTAGWGAWGTAGQLEEAGLVWSGAGWADPAAAVFVGGADGGGRATGDAAALRGDPAAGHGQEVGLSLLVS